MTPPPATPLRIAPAHWQQRLALYGAAATRAIEQRCMTPLPPHTLMQRAGLAVARLALAVAPHARHIWIACGPGNNGGDGLQAAALLQQWGKRVAVSLLAAPDALPPDARAAHVAACAAGVRFVEAAPELTPDDLCIDALLGLGSSRAPAGALQQAIDALNASAAPVLSIDLPTGLDADTGAWLGDTASACVQAQHTLSLLTLKPGLFGAQGRDAAGNLWLDTLGCGHDDAQETPTAWLCGAAACGAQRGGARASAEPDDASRSGAHASHKGTRGDVCVVGGAAGMEGAALLAGSAALHCGAGCVHVGLLSPTHPACPPELMLRHIANQADIERLPLQRAVIVAGCGGAQSLLAHLPELLRACPQLLLDADALNAISSRATLRDALRQRAAQGQLTVLTPHPLEAARLLGGSAADIQRNRLRSAQTLADATQSLVVLKGSGSVLAAPAALLHRQPCIHHAGNARLATGGTGDVLAGCIAAHWAQWRTQPHTPHAAWSAAHAAASAAIHAHGHVADQWSAPHTLTASALAQALPRAALPLAFEKELLPWPTP